MNSISRVRDPEVQHTLVKSSASVSGASTSEHKTESHLSNTSASPNFSTLPPDLQSLILTRPSLKAKDKLNLARSAKEFRKLVVTPNILGNDDYLKHTAWVRLRKHYGPQINAEFKELTHFSAKLISSESFIKNANESDDQLIERYESVKKQRRLLCDWYNQVPRAVMQAVENSPFAPDRVDLGQEVEDYIIVRHDQFSSPLAYGTDHYGRPFLAMRLLARRQRREDESAVVNIFTIFQRYSDAPVWSNAGYCLERGRADTMERLFSPRFDPDSSSINIDNYTDAEREHFGETPITTAELLSKLLAGDEFSALDFMGQESWLVNFTLDKLTYPPRA